MIVSNLSCFGSLSLAKHQIYPCWYLKKEDKNRQKREEKIIYYGWLQAFRFLDWIALCSYCFGFVPHRSCCLGYRVSLPFHSHLRCYFFYKKNYEFTLHFSCTSCQCILDIHINHLRIRKFFLISSTRTEKKEFAFISFSF